MSFDLVDAAFAETGKAEKQIRDLLVRVVVYLLVVAERQAGGSADARPIFRP